MHDTIIVLDFGAQYNQLIVRRVRELNVYAELLPHDTPWHEIIKKNPKGIILSGGPSSVYAHRAPHCDKRVFTSSIPVLGICYGQQLMAYLLDGKVQRGTKGEYGKAIFKVSDTTNPLFKKVPRQSPVWMSHFDTVSKVPSHFKVIGTTETCAIAAMAGKIQSNQWNKFSIQFHPEVLHTLAGTEIIKNFVFDICHATPNWTSTNFIKEAITSIRQQVGTGAMLCAVSGGVDSSVVAALINKAVGKQLTCVFVDHGLLRKNEVQEVKQAFKKLHIPLRTINAQERFFKKLAGVQDPETKRKIIGHEFIRIFEEQAKTIPGLQFLAQGTLYPDIIESKTAASKAGDKIKTHHNVGGLPARMKLQLVEPLRLLFKDEVRAVGKKLGLPAEIIERHPFPGPGLAVRIIGEVTGEKVALLQRADAIFIEELKTNTVWLTDRVQKKHVASSLYSQLFQAFAILTSLQSVGVMGDERTYRYVLAIRAVVSDDAMTADWAKIPSFVLEKISSRIVNEVKGINRVVYDITTKPPATIEWE